MRARRRPNARNGNAPMSGATRAQRGQAATEFIIVAPIVLLLCLGLIQFGLLYQAKSTLNYAALMAARAGAVNHGTKSAMLSGLARGLAPLFTHQTGLSAQQMAILSAQTEARNPGITKLTVVSPTAAAFSDFARTNYYAGKTVREIPNDTLMYRDNTPGNGSPISIQDANLLKISVQYCYELYVPFINRVIYSLVNGTSDIFSTGSVDGSLDFGTDGNSCRAYSAISGGYRIPIQAEAVVRMQSPFRGG